MSIIAIAAVMSSVSPLCVNAVYSETITKQEYSGYIKYDYLSNQDGNYYISEKADEKNPYILGALYEKRLNDRIYVKLKSDSSLSELTDILKNIKTENGDSYYYHTEKTDVFDGYISASANLKFDNPIKTINSNDARKIKNVVDKNIVTDMFYSDNVYSQQKGTLYLTDFAYPIQYYQAIGDDKGTIKEETLNTLEKYIKDKEFNVTIDTTDEIKIIPNKNMTLEEHLDMINQISKDLGLSNISEWIETEENNLLAIDLLNAVVGDANCDEHLDMADAVLIMQALANPNKYQLSAQGRFNADLEGNGITVGDAQAIQQILLNLR